jgi:signal transduction histidine kinase
VFQIAEGNLPRVRSLASGNALSLHAATALGLTALCMGALVLIGWEFDVTLLKAGWPGLRATQPLTAVMVAACALPLIAAHLRVPGSAWVRMLPALFVFGLTTFIIAENVADADWGTDRMLFRDTIVSGQTGLYLRAGRPAGSALVSLLALSLALLLMRSRSAWAGRAFVWLTTFVLLASLSVVFAYAFGVPSLQAMGLYARVGLVGAAATWFLSVGMLILRSDIGWIAELCGDSAGAVTSRHLLAWTGGVMVVSAVVIHVGTIANWYRAEVAVAIVALSGIAVLFSALLAYGRRLTLAERQSRQEVHGLNTHKAAFLHDLAHELRNPLAPISTSVELLRLHVPPGTHAEGAFFILDRQVRKLSTVVDKSIADYSKATPEPGDFGWRPDREVR